MESKEKINLHKNNEKREILLNPFRVYTLECAIKRKRLTSFYYEFYSNMNSEIEHLWSPKD